jgi:hypothetical protein
MTQILSAVSENCKFVPTEAPKKLPAQRVIRPSRRQPACSPTSQQLSLFSEDRLPHHPYCSPEKGAHLIRALDRALDFPYMQINSPSLKWWMVFDIDRKEAAYAWRDANLPPPAWTTSDPISTKAHTAYALEIPVITSDAARAHPMRYLRHVEYGMALALGSDLSYSGLITKNPIHPDWKTWIGPQVTYTLEEFGEYIEIPKKIPAKAKELGVGRNCETFEHLAKWSYKNVMQAKQAMRFESWIEACVSECERFNTGFKTPMTFSEVKAIGRSVARWTWNRFGTGEHHARFIERQQQKGVKSGQARFAASEDKRTGAVLMRAKGMTYAAIAAELDVSVSVAHGYCNKTI